MQKATVKKLLIYKCYPSCFGDSATSNSVVLNEQKLTSSETGMLKTEKSKQGQNKIKQ